MPGLFFYLWLLGFLLSFFLARRCLGFLLRIGIIVLSGLHWFFGLLIAPTDLSYCFHRGLAYLPVKIDFISWVRATWLLLSVGYMRL